MEQQQASEQDDGWSFLGRLVGRAKKAIDGLRVFLEGTSWKTLPVVNRKMFCLEMKRLKDRLEREFEPALARPFPEKFEHGMAVELLRMCLAWIDAWHDAISRGEFEFVPSRMCPAWFDPWHSSIRQGEVDSVPALPQFAA